MAIQKVCHLLLLPPSFLQLASDVDKYSRKQREKGRKKKPIYDWAFFELSFIIRGTTVYSWDEKYT